jgi:hypothetical protein
MMLLCASVGKVKRAAQSPIEFLPKGCYGRAPLQSMVKSFAFGLVLDRDCPLSGVKVSLDP